MEKQKFIMNAITGKGEMIRQKFDTTKAAQEVLKEIRKKIPGTVGYIETIRTKEEK